MTAPNAFALAELKSASTDSEPSTAQLMAADTLLLAIAQDEELALLYGTTSRAAINQILLDQGFTKSKLHKKKHLQWQAPGIYLADVFPVETLLNTAVIQYPIQIRTNNRVYTRLHTDLFRKDLGVTRWPAPGFQFDPAEVQMALQNDQLRVLVVDWKSINNNTKEVLKRCGKASVALIPAMYGVGRDVGWW